MLVMKVKSQRYFRGTYYRIIIYVMNFLEEKNKKDAKDI